jgi:hypothetical protein
MLGDLKAGSLEKDPSVLKLDSTEKEGNRKSAGIIIKDYQRCRRVFQFYRWLLLVQSRVV